MLCGREVCYACQLLEYSDECCWEMESCTAKKTQKTLQTQTKQLGQKRRELSLSTASIDCFYCHPIHLKYLTNPCMDCNEIQ